MTLRNHCQKAGRSTSAPDRAAPESYIAELFPHRPPMAEPQIAILKVIVSAQFFSSCYFKVQLLHNVTLINKRIFTYFFYITKTIVRFII